MNATWKDYIELTKPGIIMSNLIAALGGFWVASQWNIDWGVLVLALLGSALVMASSCTFNNYLDIDFDKKMERTSNRPLPAGRMKPVNALIFAIVLGIAGEAALFAINPLTGVLGLVGMFAYIVIYTLWLKRTSTWSTSIGGISGSMPPVIGYVAVRGELDLGALLLFALLFFWQPPHFWALGIRRKEEYRAAGYPLLPVIKGVLRTKIQMIPYVVMLIATSVLLYLYDYVGIFFLIISVGLGVVWLFYCMAGLKTNNDDVWARKTFLFSVNYLTIIFIVMILDTVRASS